MTFRDTELSFYDQHHQAHHPAHFQGGSFTEWATGRELSGVVSTQPVVALCVLKKPF